MLLSFDPYLNLDFGNLSDIISLSIMMACFPDFSAPSKFDEILSLLVCLNEFFDNLPVTQVFIRLAHDFVFVIIGNLFPCLEFENVYYAVTQR